MEFILYYVIAGVFYTIFDFVSKPERRDSYLRNKFIFILQVFRWPISIIKSFAQNNETKYFDFKNGEISYYRNWLKDKMEGPERNNLKDYEAAFVGQMIAVCNFEIDEFHSSFKKVEANEDFFRFEIGSYLLATILHWNNSGKIKLSQKDTNFFISEFCLISMKALSVGTEDILTMLEDRMTYYQSTLEQDKHEQGIEMLNTYMSHIIGNDFPAILSRPKNNLQIEQVSVHMSTVIWIKAYIPGSFKSIKNYSNYKSQKIS